VQDELFVATIPEAANRGSTPDGGKTNKKKELKTLETWIEMRGDLLCPQRGVTGAWGVMFQNKERTPAGVVLCHL